MSHQGSVARGAGLAWAAGCLLAAGAWAKAEPQLDRIQLEDGTAVSGQIVQRDGELVYVRIPRAAVVRVNFLASGGGAGDDQLELTDGTSVATTLLQRDADQLIVQFPRPEIAAVNGQPLPPPVAPGSRAPQFTAVDLQGATHTLAQPRKGREATLVQFWASWCPHCRSDLALMKQLYERHHGKGLRILTVSIDQELPSLKAFVEAERLPYPVISATMHPALPDLYEMRGVPAYYLIDTEGTIVKTWSGSVTESESDFEKTLATLLEQAPTPTGERISLAGDAEPGPPGARSQRRR